MLTLPRIGGVALLVVLCAACAGPPRIDTETAPSADFSQRRTFAWQDSQASYDPEPKPQDVEAVKTAIHEAVVSQLASKGYSEATQTPDFLVSFHLVVTETAAPDDLCVRRYMIFEVQISASPLDVYEICRADPLMQRRTLRKGTLVVFVVDAETRTLLWQGVADEGLVTNKNQIQKLQSAVEEMFVSFPAERA